MPINHRLRLDDHEDGPPVLPQMRQGDPEQTISEAKPWSIRRTVEDREVLTQGEVFCNQNES
ncbi:MAG: hypothetical protein ACR2HX_08990 [Pyrinomonadaceae bacterium]